MVAPLILGSASPRRAQLLAQLGLPFEVFVADIDESPRFGEAPRDYVQRMAQEKAQALVASGSVAARPLLTADTTVVLDGHSLGKPCDRSDALRMLRGLSGREHEVYTAVFLWVDGASYRALTATRVEFAPLCENMIESYLSSDEPWDKAGAYAIQGVAGSFVRAVNGSVSNVIGLPQVETRDLLHAAGLLSLATNR